MRACVRCGENNEDRARFCLECGASLIDVVPRREERKRVSVLFCDLVGFTARAEQMDIEDVRSVLATYYSRLRSDLERYGGTVEKFIGDAVMALFGAPIARGNDPERAVRAGLAICESIRELNAADPMLDLHVRIGVTTGEALVALDARPSQGEGMASGDVVNTAARLQSAAPVDWRTGRRVDPPGHGPAHRLHLGRSRYGKRKKRPDRGVASRSPSGEPRRRSRPVLALAPGRPGAANSDCSPRRWQGCEPPGRLGC